MSKKTLTLEEAYNLCVLKWQKVVEAKGNIDVVDEIPELQGLMAGCAYCELYNNDSDGKLDYQKRCHGCPLFENGYGCLEDNDGKGSIYVKIEEFWDNVQNIYKPDYTWVKDPEGFNFTSRRLAQKMLDAIIETNPLKSEPDQLGDEFGAGTFDEV